MFSGDSILVVREIRDVAEQLLRWVSLMMRKEGGESDGLRQVFLKR